MKKVTILLTILAITFGLVSCTNKPAAAPSTIEAVSPSAVDGEGVIVYRGVVQGFRTIEGNDGEVYDIIDLAQVSGHDYGPYKVGFVVYEDTVVNFVMKDLEPGHYLEIHFAFWNVTEEEMIGDSIAINYLGLPKQFNTNGIVTDISWNKDSTGTITLETIETKETVVILVQEDTIFHELEQEDIMKDMELNIFHDIAVAASAPPQISAKEIALYTEIL